MAKRLVKIAGLVAGSAAIASAITAGTAGYRRLLNPPSPALPYTSPYEPVEYYRWLFGNVAYSHAGDGPPLLLIHGIHAAASNYEFRHIYYALAQEYHVFAIDLLGYGLSDRPDIMYRADLYVQLIADFVRDVILRDRQERVHVIASSLSASYAIQNAHDYPDQYGRLVLTCPTGRSTLAHSDTRAGRTIYSIFSTPQLGRALYNGLVTRASLAYYLKRQTYYDSEQVTDEMLDSYYATSHRPGAKYAPSSFLSGYLNLPHAETFARLRQPVLLVWGKQARFTPVEDAGDYLASNPDARLVIFEECGMLPHDEKPLEFVSLVKSFFAATPHVDWVVQEVNSPSPETF